VECRHPVLSHRLEDPEQRVESLAQRVQLPGLLADSLARPEELLELLVDSQVPVPGREPGARERLGTQCHQYHPTLH
jgi:hypothetical protein